MKILQINNFHYNKGGSDAVYLNTGKLLKAKGHEVIYFSTQSDKNESFGVNSYFIEQNNFNENSIINKVKSFPKFIHNNEAVTNLKKLIAIEKPDVAHLHIFYGHFSNSILKVLKAEGIPMVMSVHEYRMLCPVYIMLDNKNNICEKCAKGNYLNAIIKKCSKGSFVNSAVVALECNLRDRFYDYKEYIDHFIMVSKFIYNKHAEYYPNLRKKSSVLYNFKEFSEGNRYPLNKEVDLIYFGRLSKEKGIITLLKSLATLKNVTLKIVGTGPEEFYIKQFIKDKKLFNIKLLGYCKGDVLWQHITSARFTVVPSEWYENNPMTIIESLMLGVPVIGSRIGGIPEIITKKHGFIFDMSSVNSLRDEIEKSTKIDQEAYNEMSINAINFAQDNFSPDPHYNSLVNIYSKMILN